MNEEILRTYCLGALSPYPGQPKFKLFSSVKLNDRLSKSTGKVVGCQWWSLMRAFEQSDYPGWWYTVDIGGACVNRHESQIAKLPKESA
jgi:hypothetical protein